MTLSEEREGLWDTERRSYTTVEDRQDSAGAVPSSKIRYKIVDQLRGESKNRWVRMFGDC